MRKSDEKRCTKCYESKLLAEFNKQADSPDGYKYMCRVCQRAQEKKRAAVALARRRGQRLQEASFALPEEKVRPVTASPSFVSLIQQNMPGLRHRATHIHWKYLGGLPSYGMEDLLQDTLEDLLCSKKDLGVQGVDNLYGLFFLRCTQIATNKYRRERMISRHTMSYLAEPSTEETEEEKLARKAFADAVITYLSPVQQEILHKRAERKKHEVIAKELHTSVDTVQYQYAKAKSILKSKRRVLLRSIDG